MELALIGKQVLITGGCGEIGTQMAQAFLLEGSHVMLLDTDTAIANSADRLHHLSQIGKGTLSTVACDITDSNALSQLPERVSSLAHTIDVLINNAGINRLTAATAVTELLWDEIMDVNLKGAFFVSKIVADLMIKGGGGSIINISSQHGLVGNYDRAPYCASKGGMVNLTRALCLDWAKYNIRVNCLCPTYVMHEKSKEQLMQPVFYRSYIREIPLRRYCTPQDVASAALFLASSVSSMITGQCLAIDGGYLAH